MAPAAARGGPTKVSVGHSMGQPLPTLVLVPTLTHTPCPFNHDLTHQTDGLLFAQQLLTPVMPIEPELSVSPSMTSAATPSSILLVQPSASDKRPAAPLVAPLTAKEHIVATGLLHDCLGTSIADLSRCLHSAPSWASFIHDVRGPSYLTSMIQDIPHTATPYLQRLHDNGTRVNMDDPPWDTDHIATCAAWGPHPSAILHCDFLHDEFADFINAGFWVILPLEQIQSLHKDL